MTKVIFSKVKKIKTLKVIISLKEKIYISQVNEIDTACLPEQARGQHRWVFSCTRSSDRMS